MSDGRAQGCFFSQEKRALIFTSPERLRGVLKVVSPENGFWNF